MSEVTKFNVGKYCLSEDDCIAQGISFAAYERGVADAAEAFSRNQNAEIADMQEQLALKDKKIDHITTEAEKVEEQLERQAGLITQMQAVLADWLAFSVDVMPSCAAGADWLDSLRSKTKTAIEKEMGEWLNQEKTSQKTNVSVP